MCCDQGQIAIIEPNRLHPLNVGLAVLKKHERGVLRLNISKACTYLMTNARTASVKRFSVNSFIYPYHSFPPNPMFSMVAGIEGWPIMKKVSTHSLILARLH